MSGNDQNIGELNKVILPIMRRVLPNVIANEIIGVQPMTGPVASIFNMDGKFRETLAFAWWPRFYDGYWRWLEPCWQRPSRKTILDWTKATLRDSLKSLSESGL